MKISALTVCHNEQRILGYCLMAVNQFVDEHIIVDNQSTDKTCEVIEKCKQLPGGEKFKIYTYPYQQDNFEMAALRNYGLEQCTGDWIWLIDSDEIYTEKDAKAVRELLEKTTDRDILSYRINYYHLIKDDRHIQRGFEHYPDKLYRRLPITELRFNGLLPQDVMCYHGQMLEYSDSKKQPIIKDIRFWHYARTDLYRTYDERLEKWTRYIMNMSQVSREEAANNAKNNGWVTLNIQTDDLNETPPEVFKKYYDVFNSYSS